MKLDLKNKKKIIIKIGSALLVEKKGVRKTWLKKLAKDISDLVKKDYEVAIVSSGAIALGKKYLQVKKENLSLAEKQAAAAIGQIELMRFYQNFFNKFKIKTAQILLSAEDCNLRSRYLNCQNTIKTLFQNKIVPIINENDSVSVNEIKVGDNDRLAARVSHMVSADLLILFSDIDGLYDKNPKKYKTAKLIPEVLEITKEIENMADGKTSTSGTGGMTTKILAAKMLKKSACDVIITNGLENDCLKKLINGKQNFTIFRSKNNLKKSKKKWIAGIMKTKGSVVINDRAAEALKNKKVSLLPVGVVSAKGRFSAGDMIYVFDQKDNHIASGISNYGSANLRKIFLKNSKEVKEVLGKDSEKELIHIDNLAVI
jgi:glutamate 5-kinase